MRVLLLGGTTEASNLARQLAGDTRFRATLSLAGVTRNPAPSTLARRIGGFGGASGLYAWLRAEDVTAVVDATHPFAARISCNAAAAAAAAGIPLLRIARPPWEAEPGDRWVRVQDVENAAAALGRTPRRVLLTVGSKSLKPFRAAPMHDYVIRCIDAPDSSLLPPRAALLLARGPFALHSELALLESHRIQVLVCKNSGGEATSAKLQAARQAGLPVIMIDRPRALAVADGAIAADAMQWLLRLHQEATTALPRGA